MPARRAHAGVATLMYDTVADRSFQSFCERQRSRVAALAQTAHRRYVRRITTVIADETPDVTVKGYGIGGGPARAKTVDE